MIEIGQANHTTHCGFAIAKGVKLTKMHCKKDKSKTLRAVFFISGASYDCSSSQFVFDVLHVSNHHSFLLRSNCFQSLFIALFCSCSGAIGSFTLFQSVNLFKMAITVVGSHGDVYEGKYIQPKISRSSVDKLSA